jgi:putative aldouronate transport system substrate-binding protein
MPGQQQAMDAWMQKDFEFRTLPKLSYTSEESSELTAILADLETYIEQMSMKFVLGTESLDSFDAFVATCESMRAEDARLIQQAAMDRYNAR